MDILYVEDDPRLREQVARQLDRLDGCKVTAVANGMEAWKLLQGGGIRPGIIVSDYDMPKMTGVQLLLKVRGDLRYSHIPFRLFTASDKDEEGQALRGLCEANQALFSSKKGWEGDVGELLKLS